MEKPAIDGGKSVRDKFLPVALPWINEEEINIVGDILRSGWLTTGPKVKEFEEKFANYVNAGYAVALNSCTGAMHCALLALGIKKGDEVITSTLTFAATGHVIQYVGAKPVLVDIKKDTYNIDPEEIKNKITKNTKAVISVDYAGQPCDYDEILKIANEYNLYTIDDSAHAVGAEYKGKKIGTLCDVTCFSFYAIKNMTTGEGGMATTNNDNFANKIRKFSYFGISKDAWKRYAHGGKWYYEIEDLGYKYNMMDIQAVMGLKQLEKVDGFNEIRRNYAKYLTDKLSKIPEIQIPIEKNNLKHVRHLYPIVVKTEMLKIDRNKFIDALNAENIGTSVHFIPLHRHPYYQKTFGYKVGDFPVADYVYERFISLPLYPKITERDLDNVVDAVKKIVEWYRK